MTTLIKRQVRFYESINAVSNVNFMLDFECTGDNNVLRKEHVTKAFRLVQKRHPYFRMQIKTNSSDGTCEFVETANLDENFDLVYASVESEADFKDWQSRLIEMGSNTANLGFLVHLELYSFRDQFFKLFGCVNHAGIDGPGLFQTLHDFIVYLDAVLGGTDNLLNIESRSFLDVHADYRHSFSLDELKKEPIINEYVEAIKPNNDKLDDDTAVPHITAKFFQFDEDLTKNLVYECKSNGVTVQAVLSTVEMIAFLKYTNVTESGSTFINSCPCNMRPYLTNVSKEDIISGSAALIWPYHVDLNEPFWVAAQKTNESIKIALDTNYGLKWWLKLANSIPTQPFSIMSSSMGVVSLVDQQQQLKRIRLNDLRFLGSSYKLKSGVAGLMTHVFTCMNRFTLSFSYTYPALSHAWAHTFSSNIWRVLELVAHSKLKEVSLREVIEQLSKH